MRAHSSPATASSRRRSPRDGRARERVRRCRAFVPPIVPNPNGDDARGHGNADSATLPNIERALRPLGWAIGAERGYDDTPHAYKMFKTRDGMRALEALQERLYVRDERGCRIRRETQSLWYMCCDGVRCRMNDGKHEIIVEMPLELATVRAHVEKAKTIEETIKAANKRG